MAAGLLEDLEFALMEHLHLADMVAVAGALIGPQLEDAFGLRRRTRRRHQLRPTLEGRQESALHPQKSGCRRRSVPERLGGLQELGILREMQIQHREALDRGMRNQQIIRRRLRAEVETECPDRPRSDTGQCRDQSVAKIALGQLRLRPRLQLVTPKLVKLPGFGCRRLRPDIACEAEG